MVLALPVYQNRPKSVAKQLQLSRKSMEKRTKRLHNRGGIEQQLSRRVLSGRSSDRREEVQADLSRLGLPGARLAGDDHPLRAVLLPHLQVRIVDDLQE